MRDERQKLKIELLSQWKLEAEFRNTMECWKEMLIETCIRAKDNIDEDALNKKLEERLNDRLDHIQ